MKIGIIGSGTMGRSIGMLWARLGHDVLFGTRDTARKRDWIVSLKGKGEVGTYSDAVHFGDFIFLATAWKETKAAISTVRDFQNKVLIDVTNPELPGGRGLEVGHDNSGAELIAQWAPNAKVVKAFNHVYAQLLDSQVELKKEAATIFYCGDDGDAKKMVSGLIEQSGFESIDVGPLQSARYLEPLAALLVQIVGQHPWSPDRVAFRLLHP